MPEGPERGSVRPLCEHRTRRLTEAAPLFAHGQTIVARGHWDIHLETYFE